jgi:hypothetical protein
MVRIRRLVVGVWGFGSGFDHSRTSAPCMIEVKAHWNGGPVDLSRVSVQRRKEEEAQEMPMGW